MDCIVHGVVKSCTQLSHFQFHKSMNFHVATLIKWWSNNIANISSLKNKISPFALVSSVQSLSCVWLFVTTWTAALRLPLPSPIPGVYWLMPICWWCHPTISFSVIPFSSCLQSFPASGSFLMSHFFTSGGQSIGVSASASVLPMNIQGWFPLGWTGWMSLQSKGLSRVFSNTTVQKHQFLSTRLSL